MAEHLVRFYDEDEDLARAMASFAIEAIHHDGVVVLIATEDHRLAIESELRLLGCDISDAMRLGSLWSAATDAVLAACTTGGDVEQGAFLQVVGSLLAEATVSGRRAVVYDDMMVHLWEAGQVPAAIEVERLWAELDRERPFTRFCAYPSELATSGDGSSVLRRLYGPEATLRPPMAHNGKDNSRAEISAAAEFAAHWSAPGTARRWARSVLGHWQLASDQLLDDISLAVTELANNAVIHARSTFTVGLHTDTESVCVSVHDDSLSLPAPGSPGVTERFGRGLGIVAALSTSWGVDTDDSGKVVWAHFAGSRPN